MDHSTQRPLLRIAVIGSGPAGLGSAIALSSLPHTKVSLFEQTHKLREVGAGIRIGFNCWRVLELLGVEGAVKGWLKREVFQRNGLTGEILKVNRGDGFVEKGKYCEQRVRRTVLQGALVEKVPNGIINLGKRVVSLKDLDSGVLLKFEDGTDETADLIVGGDGIRSVVREQVFPEHNINFNGTTIWRALVPVTSISRLPDITLATTWWHGPAGHIYTSLVDDPSEICQEDQMFEISARSLTDPATTIEERYSWGIPSTNERVESHFMDFDRRIKEVLKQVPEGLWREFSAFAGPRLEKLVAWDKVVLIGDASHPLSGAFGSGAAFALEDGWILARAIEHTRSSGRSVSDAINIFDSIRSPYYARMYAHLDREREKMQERRAANPSLSFEDSLKARMDSDGSEDKLGWIHGNDIEKMWRVYLEEENANEWLR